MKSWKLAAVLPVLLALFLAACGPRGGSGSPLDAAPGRATEPPAIGLLLGTSPADHVLHQARAWAGDARLVARAAGRSRAHVVIDRFGPGPSSSNVVYDARVASTTGLNKLVIGNQLRNAEWTMESAFARESASTTPGPINLVSGVRSLAQHLQAFPHQTTNVVIFGDAVQTAAPVDLADPLQLADTRESLRSVISRGLVSPAECRGWRVYMVGGSLTPDGGLSSLQDEQLREFWREFFAYCGGRLVVWDSTLISFPSSGQVPPARWTAQHKLIIPLPSSVLFRPNRAVFLPGARPVLDELARKLTVLYPRATAVIAGFTAMTAVPISGPSALVLSRARARAVAAYLRAHGVSADRLRTHGYGDQHQIPGGLAANRRVVVILHLP